MEVTKKEEQRENKEVKRPEIDPAIIEELMKGYEQPSDLTGTWRDHGRAPQAALRTSARG
jgi:hypothetical protein